MSNNNSSTLVTSKLSTKDLLWIVIAVLIGIACILGVATWQPPMSTVTAMGEASVPAPNDVYVTLPRTYSYAIDTDINRPGIQAHSPRHNACRTWVIGGYDATDGVDCGTTTNTHRTKTTITTTITVVPPVVVITPPPTTDNDKKHCNKGSGNGSEGCDPGNHPEKGNNDEGGDKHPDNANNGKKDKKDK